MARIPAPATLEPELWTGTPVEVGLVVGASVPVGCQTAELVALEDGYGGGTTATELV